MYIGKSVEFTESDRISTAVAERVVLKWYK